MKEEEVVVVFPIEVEKEGEDEQTSTRQLWSVTNVINLDIFYINVLLGTKKHIMQSLMGRKKCF
jgi:hypothetical protein